MRDVHFLDESPEEIKSFRKNSTHSSDLWYKRFPTRFRKDTVHQRQLHVDLRGHWSLVTDLFYEHGGPLPNNDRWMAMMLFCDVRKWKRIREQLLEHKLVFIGDDGLIHNRTADEVLGERQDKLAQSTKSKTKRKLGKGLTPDSTPDSTPPSTPDSTPDHLFQNTNDINEGHQKNPLDTRATKIEEERKEEDTPLPPKGGKGPSPMEVLEAFKAYNDTALRCGIPQAAKLTPDRQRKIAARLRDYGVAGWTQALANIEKSSHLTGSNDRGWRADLDFVCQPKSFGRLHDGGYGNGRHAKPQVDLAAREQFREAIQRARQLEDAPLC